MDYLHRHAPLKANPKQLLPSAQTLIVVACNYFWPVAEQDYQVARYARGDDYHGLMKNMLEVLAKLILAEEPHVEYRVFVDSGPLLEKELAQRAGLGWIGKHTNLINPQKGSWFLLGCLMTNLKLPWDQPFEGHHCGTCTRCLVACPTEAILSPHLLDARRCISYLTIETRGEIPLELREGMGNHIFGCDVCQEVCPWNIKFAKPTELSGFIPREWLKRFTLADLLRLTEFEFSRIIAPLSPIKRPKFQGFLRNVIVAAGNSANLNLLPVLQELQVSTTSPILQLHLEWAIERLGG